MDPAPFPPAFRFGVATADHQCESYEGHDDIRDVWERVRGLTPRGTATDFWNRYREDVDLAKGLGCRAFRLSLSWARLEPAAGTWDAAAFAHYRDVLGYMRDAGMATVVTLHHNTWPVHVQAAGNGAGMLDPGFPDRLAAYARAVARELGDLIDYYVTINEPNQLVYGFIKGWWMRAYPVPPGLEPYATSAQQMDAVIKLIPNLFLAHARSRAAIRELRPEAKVGANPLILGLPRWIQFWVDRNATHLRNPSDLRTQAVRISQHHILDSGVVDISIAQIAMTHARMDRVLFSEPYYAVGDKWYAVAMALGSRSLLNVVDQAVREFKKERGLPALGHNRKTVADVGKGESPDPGAVPDLDRSLRKIRTRGRLRVGIQPGAAGLCVAAADGGYSGIEPDLARAIAARVFGVADAPVEFKVLSGTQRVDATRSWLGFLDPLRKTISMLTTIVGTNWWNLGMAGKLPRFLCPPECIGALDYVGLDYYWGVPSIWPSELQRLAAASECRYASAPVWSDGLYDLLREEQQRFPGKPIVVIENGCVTNADGISRAEYLSRHLREVQRAVADGVPVEAYLCWSITSNREWGLHFDDNSDFGLYHIDLDSDGELKRVRTSAADRYAEIIKAGSTNAS